MFEWANITHGIAYCMKIITKRWQ